MKHIKQKKNRKQETQKHRNTPQKTRNAETQKHIKQETHKTRNTEINKH